MWRRLGRAALLVEMAQRVIMLCAIICPASQTEKWLAFSHRGEGLDVQTGPTRRFTLPQATWLAVGK